MYHFSVAQYAASTPQHTAQQCVLTAPVWQKGGIDIIQNEASYRVTPALVTFGEDQRYIGQAAAAQAKRFVANTVTNVKRLIGRKFKEEDVQRELPYLAYTVKELPDGDCGIQVKHNGTVKTFTPVQICGALLGQLKKTAQDSLSQEVGLCVMMSVGTCSEW
jgi:heat shock protein 4